MLRSAQRADWLWVSGSVFSGISVLPVVRPVSGDTLGQRQRAAEEHDVSVAGQSAEVAEEPETHHQSEDDSCPHKFSPGVLRRPRSACFIRTLQTNCVINMQMCFRWESHRFQRCEERLCVFGCGYLSNMSTSELFTTATEEDSHVWLYGNMWHWGSTISWQLPGDREDIKCSVLNERPWKAECPVY